MSFFFEFIISLLRNLPQHENLLRFMVLNQFNYIMFGLMFGGNPEIRKEFLESVLAQFLDYVNPFLTESNDMVLLKLKQVSNPVIQEQQLLVQRMYDLLKDKLDIEQVCIREQQTIAIGAKRDRIGICPESVCWRIAVAKKRIRCAGPIHLPLDIEFLQ
mgnify:CR=1 FL=1